MYKRFEMAFLCFNAVGIVVGLVWLLVLVSGCSTLVEEVPIMTPVNTCLIEDPVVIVSNVPDLPTLASPIVEPVICP